MTRFVCLLALLAWAAGSPVVAQSDDVVSEDVVSEIAHLWVDAEAGAVVVDGERRGVPGEWLAVEAGDRDVGLVDDPAAWDPRRSHRIVALAPGDSARVVLTLPRRVRIETLPIRATVVRETASGADTLGTAPLTLDLAPGETATLSATLDGYEPARQTVGADEVVTLILPAGPDAAPEVALLPTERSTARRTLVDLGIGAAALAAGAVAVHFKFRADRIDDRYRSETDPDFANEALRDEALRLDRYSAVALGAMQVGVGALAVRFILR